MHELRRRGDASLDRTSREDLLMSRSTRASAHAATGWVDAWKCGGEAHPSAVR